MSFAQQVVTVQAPAAPPPPTPPSPQEQQLRQEINQTIRAAQDAARDAARAQQQAIGRGEGQIIRIGPSVGGGPRGGITIDDGRFGRGPYDGGIPRQAVDIALGFFAMCVVLVIGWPIARAFGRRLERKADGGASPAMADQLQRIEQAVEAMSIEVERISESQRFIARLQNERLPEAVERQKV